MMKPLVLIVEDEGIIANRILDTLEEAGYPATIADTGNDAIRKAQELKPGLVLMDIRLKGDMDGIEAASHILKHADIPLIYLTAFSDDALLQRAKLTKPHGYLIKPFRERELLVNIEVVLHKRLLDQQQQELESRIQYLQRMKSLGTMAGAIAHHVNNKLMVISGYMEMILENSVTPPQIKSDAQIVFDQCRGMKDLIDQITAFTGNLTSASAIVNLSRLIREIAPILSLALPEGCVIRYHLDDEIPSLKAVTEQIKQIIFSLVENAVEAIEDRTGAIIISSGVMEVDRDFLAKSYPDYQLMECPIPEGQYIYLTVADNGCGMDEVIQSHLFEPFFTTKFFGRGLGLPAVLGIVKSLRGAVSISSKPTVGAIVTIILPITQ